MVMVLDQELVDEIARLGRERSPNECCGILLPHPVKGRSVYELPNRSKLPHDSFELWGSDLVLTIEAIPFDYEFNIDELTIWHTHPNGGVGPSKADMDNKPPKFKHLVVTLAEDSQAMATWF